MESPTAAIAIGNGLVFAAGLGAALFKRAGTWRGAGDCWCPVTFDPPVTLRVGGVPEHFNEPFKDAIAPLAKCGLCIEWVSQPGGTGVMTKGLREATLDVAIVLTEGILADMAKGNPSLLVSQYVQSPLQWGVHVATGSSYQSIGELRGRRFGISRYGSGSHLMAYLLAKEHGWDLTNLRFVVVGGIDKAREAFAAHEIDGFMWEEYTTKPLVYSGEWRCVGTCTTPWPCFAVAVRSAVLDEHADAVRAMMDAVRVCASQFKAKPEQSAHRVVDTFGLKLGDARSWLAMTEWSCTMGMDEKMLRNCVSILRHVGVLTADVDVHPFIYVPS
ncbi:ABC-type nitrate/sulfonate/bicarbonate transport system, periplasmic component [Pavlovales sp. CCMP2436]|nr:ABC-type nitrate/sulfonate/bicarbonate transport system, periplasmic component [Pavlovales sp. CCMP2436]|mmetsp:Transcript_35838/g.83032  ORF Transcript_35838/g.83032 Transcript_35838/m.83032 type:complete len:330 (+) Transcript_35838:105-1094(+)